MCTSDRTDTALRHVRVDPAARAGRRLQRPVAQEIAHRNRGHAAVDIDLRRLIVGEHDASGEFRGQLSAGDERLIDGDGVRRRHVAAADRRACNRHLMSHDARHVDGKLVHLQVERCFRQAAVGRECEIAAAGHMRARLDALERRVVDQKPSRRAVVARRKFQRPHMDGLAEAVDDAGSAEAEIGGAHLRAVREGEAARDIRLHVERREKRKELCIRREALRAQARDADIACHVVAGGRKIEHRFDVRRRAGDFDMRIDTWP